ncbi:MAG: ATP-dependent Clp protease ATP-binding subunit [Spirochaetaceae bacterium]|jgi:ATP-dependent Clp protease ATP-binding subunit ClpC|nr:ATP-dependent Clp protease ATP-binding subunit [Spirochaetaceae bacterium]
MFKGLTLRAQRILAVDAQQEARRCFSAQLEPEHILIAILRDSESVAVKALLFLQIDTVQLRKAMESMVLFEDKNPVKYGVFENTTAPFSKRTKLLLQNAEEESRNLNSGSIGTEHILIAALYETDSCIHDFFAAQLSGTGVLRLVLQTNFRQSAGGAGTDKAGDAAIVSGVPGCFQPFVVSEAPACMGRSLRQQNSALDQFTRSLTTLALDGELDPVIGREKEILRMVRIMSRRTKNNPVLVGEAGTGKSAIAEGLAQYLVGPDAPAALSRTRILSLDMGAVVAGTKYRGEFEERMKRIIKDAEQNANIVLFIDEIHTVIGAGSAAGTLDASNMLKPALSRGKFQCIGATTLAEYRKYIEKDGALERRFQMILVEEPDIPTTEMILHGLAPRYADFHNVTYSSEAISATALLASRYISGRMMPDKAIDVLDEAGALKKLRSASSSSSSPCPAEISRIEQHILALDGETNEMLNTAHFDEAHELRERARELRSALDSARADWEKAAGKGFNEVDEGDIREVISEMCGIPVFRIEGAASKRLLGMEDELKTGLIGQDEAVSRIVAAIRRGKARLSDPDRPLGTFLFMGPTGVGKTLLARRLAEYLFGAEDALFRIDMSDFMERHNASRLVGSPPGYVGYDEGGLLTEKIRRNPYSVVLFDEIEKAHRDVFNLLLPILEEGELKDNLGHTVSFRNAVIIITSNAGAAEISRGTLGFTAGGVEPNFKDMDEAARREARRLFTPEFLNRLDDIVVFKPLDEIQLDSILDIQLTEFTKRLTAEYGLSLRITQEARKILLETGRDPKYGARPLRRSIQNNLEAPLSLMLLAGKIPAGAVILAHAEDGKIEFDWTLAQADTIERPSPG